MKTQKATLGNYDEVMTMYRNFLVEAYPNREVQGNYYLSKVVSSWFEMGADLYLAILEDGKVGGFSLSFVDTQGGTLSPIYRAEICYVKPEYRKKKKIGYELLKLPIAMAKEVGLNVISKSTVYNGTNKLHSKLGGTLSFQEMEINHV